MFWGLLGISLWYYYIVLIVLHYLLILVCDYKKTCWQDSGECGSSTSTMKLIFVQTREFLFLFFYNKCLDLFEYLTILLGMYSPLSHTCQLITRRNPLEVASWTEPWLDTLSLFFFFKYYYIWVLILAILFCKIMLLPLNNIIDSFKSIIIVTNFSTTFFKLLK